MNDTRSPRINKKLVIILIGALVIVGSFLAFDIKSIVGETLEWIKGLGPAGAMFYVLLYVLVCVFVLPGSILTLGAGAIYGLPLGFALTSVGSTLGAAAAFIIGRYFARDAVVKKIEGNATFEAIDEAVAQQGWRIVFLTRLTPALPFNLQNYGYGLTNIPFFHYVLASWLGMMPATVLYVYLGMLGGDVAKEETTAGEWALYTVGLIATIVVTVFITRIAQKALREAVKTEQPSE